MTVCCSVVLHLAVYFFILNVQFPVSFKEAPVYYVDMVNLPVANPQVGTPGATAKLPAQPQPAPPPRPPEMVLPAKPAAKPTARQTAAITKTTEAPETAQEYEERLARLDRDAGARHQAAALEALKKKAAGTSPVGIPGATGNEAGGDYASYIQSRLKDAFKTTIAFQSKNPEVVIRITIGKTGRILRIRIERSSGDKIFEDAVSRAIIKAEKSFVPPPKGIECETGFVFRPQGIGKN